MKQDMLKMFEVEQLEQRLEMARAGWLRPHDPTRIGFIINLPLLTVSDDPNPQELIPEEAVMGTVPGGYTINGQFFPEEPGELFYDGEDVYHRTGDYTFEEVEVN